MLREVLLNKQEACIVLATGASQFEMLSALLEEPDIDWHRVIGFHLDEYIGLPVTHPASFRKYLWDRFVSHLPVPMRQFHFIQADLPIDSELLRLNALLQATDIDVAFIGIGENGHLAFNDPPANFDTRDPYIQVGLDEACRQQQLGEGWFPTLESVPTMAISMSIHSIMQSKAIVCTVPDTRKAQAVQRALEGPVTPDVPASVLQHHKNCFIFLDENAASLLGNSET